MRLRLTKKELVAMLMESPMYFDLKVWERLELLRDHIRRWYYCNRLLGLATLNHGAQVDPAGPAASPGPPGGADDHRQTRLVVGYFPPKRLVST